jgi:hypothetical protein
MIGDNGHVEAYLENWRSEVSGRRIKNSDRAFLNWLDLNLAKKHQAGLALIEEDTLGGLLEAWDGNR